MKPLHAGYNRVACHNPLILTHNRLFIKLILFLFNRCHFCPPQDGRSSRQECQGDSSWLPWRRTSFLPGKAWWGSWIGLSKCCVYVTPCLVFANVTHGCRVFSSHLCLQLDNQFHTKLARMFFLRSDRRISCVIWNLLRNARVGLSLVTSIFSTSFFGCFCFSFTVLYVWLPANV